MPAAPVFVKACHLLLRRTFRRSSMITWRKSVPVPMEMTEYLTKHIRSKGWMLYRILEAWTSDGVRPCDAEWLYPYSNMAGKWPSQASHVPLSEGNFPRFRSVLPALLLHLQWRPAWDLGPGQRCPVWWRLNRQWKSGASIRQRAFYPLGSSTAYIVPLGISPSFWSVPTSFTVFSSFFQARDPEQVQKHIKKCFEGVKSLELQPPAQNRRWEAAVFERWFSPTHSWNLL